MAQERPPIDITNMPDLSRLVEEVRASNQARVLQRNHETVAVLIPAGRHAAQPHRHRHISIDAALAAIRASAGSWKGVDTEQLKRDLRDARGSGLPR